MSLLRGVGARLVVALVLVLAVALGTAWYVLVPSLERNLTEAKLDSQVERARVAVDSFPVFSFLNPAAGPQVVSDWATEHGALTNTRVVVFAVRGREPRAELEPIADSRQEAGFFADAEDRFAAQAAVYGRLARGVAVHEGVEYATTALPVREAGAVVLFSSPLEDIHASVELVKRRLLLAGGLGLGVALVLGFGGAGVFSRRIRRLERAADRIASGRLDEPLVDRSEDELGQLAEAFERMRVQLARLDHARREFIANASHELRTPIFALGGFLELMANEEVDESSRRDFLATMQEQLKRLERLATDLLDLSRLDAGQLALELRNVDVAGVAAALAEEFGAIARSREHPIRVERPAERVEALADETRTLQIGRALVENAIRHTPAGTPIAIAAERVDGRAVLVVEDAGPGIPPAEVREIFQRFRRGEGGHASGSGLGLAIARELAGAMGGSVGVESQPGRTVFRLELPVARPQAPVFTGNRAR